MTVLCSGDCHVYLTGSNLCTCLQGRLAKPDEVYRVAMLFPGYNPYGPHTPQQPAADVPLSRLRAAESAGAGWLSADGLIAYTMRYGRVLQADWDGARFGAWLDVGEVMPAGAVVL